MDLPSSESTDPETSSLAVRQRRSQVTYDKLIEAAFALLEDREWDSIPVAEIAERAEYSVGAFYARFKNKDEFHRALVKRYAADRLAAIEKLFATTPDETLLFDYFRDIVTWLWRNRFFWRACLFRNIREPGFWEPFRSITTTVSDNFIARATQRIGRPLTAAEQMDIRFALQVTNGAINNGMINRPGPVAVHDPEFIERLERAFRAVSRWDDLR